MYESILVWMLVEEVDGTGFVCDRSLCTSAYASLNVSKRSFTSLALSIMKESCIQLHVVVTIDDVMSWKTSGFRYVLQ